MTEHDPTPAAVTTQVNTDPAMSETDFLWSVLRQISHIVTCSRDDSAFGVKPYDALDKIADVITIANQRPKSDLGVIRQLRRKIGELEGKAAEDGLYQRLLQETRALAAVQTRELTEARAQIARHADEMYEMRKRAHDVGGVKHDPEQGRYLHWLATQLAMHDEYGGKLDLKLPQVADRLRRISKFLGFSP